MTVAQSRFNAVVKGANYSCQVTSLEQGGVWLGQPIRLSSKTN